MKISTLHRLERAFGRCQGRAQYIAPHAVNALTSVVDPWQSVAQFIAPYLCIGLIFSNPLELKLTGV